MHRAQWIGGAALAALLLWLLLFVAPALFNAHTTPGLVGAAILVPLCLVGLVRLGLALAVPHDRPRSDGHAVSKGDNNGLW